MNFTLNNKENEFSYESNVFKAFIVPALNQPGKKKWSFDVAFDCTLHLLEVIIEKSNSEKIQVTEPIITKFLNDFDKFMNLNATDHWLVLPLHKAKLDQVINFDNFRFLPSQIPREEKISYLADLFSISEKKMKWRANHTESSRSPSFFEYTLLCHKVSNYSSWITSMAQRIMLLDIALLRIIKNSLKIGSTPLFSIESSSDKLLKHNHHILISSKNPEKFWHENIWAEENSTVLQGDLNWLQSSDLHKKFIELNSLVGYEYQCDELILRFRTAIEFMNKASNTQLDSRLSGDGLALEILNFMIAAESVLLQGESKKRFLLAGRLSQLVQIKDKSAEEISDAVYKAYSWRSAYVHLGKDLFPSYDDNFHEGVVQNNVNLIRHILICFIVNLPNWIVLSDPNNVNGFGKKFASREKAWFTYLKE